MTAVESGPTVRACALLFDMDGTIVDSHTSILAVWTAFAERHRLDSVRVHAALPGRTAADIVREVIPDHTDIDGEIDWIRTFEQQSVTPVEPIPGAVQFLSLLPADRWAVVTSASRTMMLRRLTAAALPIPAVTVCAEDVAAGKPDPAPFIYAATRLGVSPADTIVFEDSTAGLVAGKDSGAFCVGIGTAPGPADIRVPDLTSVSVTVREGLLDLNFST